MDGDHEGGRAPRSGHERLGREHGSGAQRRGLIVLAGARSLRELHPRRFDVPALVVASALLLAAALRMPVLTTRQIWVHNTFSILSGIELLWNDGNRFLALLIFFFSIVFPIAKLATLLFIWLIRLTDDHRRTMLHWLMALGKWSMLDVFVVAVAVVAVKLGIFSKATPEPGIYVFGASILLSMVVTMMIDHLAGRPTER